MSFARTLFSAASVAALVSGCSLITSLDGLTEGDGVAITPGKDGGDGDDATTGGGHDAGSPPNDAAGSTGDAPLGDDDSASTSDATAPNDGSSPADTAPPVDATKPDAGPLGYCAGLVPSPLFCDDFDKSTTFSKWDKVDTNQGTTSISSAVYRSPPNAADWASNAVTTNAAAFGADKAFPSLTSTPRINTLAFDVYIEKVDTTHGAVAVLGALNLIDASNALHQFQFVVSQTSGKLVVTFPEYWDPQNGGATGYAGHSVSASISLKTWTRVSIELSLVSSTGTGSAARLYLDGTVVALTAPNIFTKNGAPHALLGLSYVAAPSDPWVVRYDNVTFNSTP